MSLQFQTTLFFLCILFPCCYLALPDSHTAAITVVQPNFPNNPSTIPAFPEQSDAAGCPLNLSDDLFDGINTACRPTENFNELHRSRCCPMLAVWLYSAYSATALGGGRLNTKSSLASSYDMPLMPDDSATCVNELGKALKVRGIELIHPNETCDAVYCYCGIRLHPLSCRDAFSVTQNGKLVGDKSVTRLERNCLSRSTNVNGFPGPGGCSKCLNSLYLLNKKASNSSKPEDRTTKIHNRDCELMGLTWLLAKNRTAYFHAVSAVFRALMLSTDGSVPQSCTLNSDGMPLAVDSSEISDHSLSINLLPPISFCLLLLSLLFCIHFTVFSS